MRFNSLVALGLFASGMQGLPIDSNTLDIEVVSNDTTSGIELGINATAAPKKEKCVESNRCDWGHICVDGFCKKGCLSKKDCWHHQWCDSKKKQCVYTRIFPPARECKTYGSSCGWPKSCCSGYCSGGFCARKLEIPKNVTLAEAGTETETENVEGVVKDAE